MILSLPIQGDKVKISVIQASIPQHKKWEKGFAKTIMKTYTDLTQAAAADRPDLIAWPETSTPTAINLDRRIFNQVARIARQTGIPLLLGSAQRRKYEDKNIKGLNYTNSAFLFNPKIRAKPQRYDKIHLLPFGEYLPTKDIIPWHLIGVTPIRGYTPGKAYTVMNLGPRRLGVPICWENIFPYITRGFVKNGAQFIVNITNAAYFGRTAAPYQVLSMTVFRAVENRVYVARAANIGISCIIDIHGRVLDRVRDADGQDVFVPGYLTGTVIPQDEKTFYTLFGDVFAWACTVAAILFVLMAFLPNNRRTAACKSN